MMVGSYGGRLVSWFVGVWFEVVSIYSYCGLDGLGCLSGCPVIRPTIRNMGLKCPIGDANVLPVQLTLYGYKQIVEPTQLKLADV